MRRLPLVAALAALTLGASPAAADIFKRVRADGVVEYSNVPSGEGWVLIVDEGGSDDAAHSGKRARHASRKERYAPFISEAAELYGLPEALIRAVIDIESSWNPNAVSPAGARGLMQLMPATARDMQVPDAFDPRGNILGGTRYLRLLANKFAGDMVLTLSAYNAGEGIVAKQMRPPYRVTRGYVESVLRRYRHYRSGGR